MNKLIITLRRSFALLFDRVGIRLRNNFYLFLASIFTLIAIIDMSSLRFLISMRNKSFDMMVKHRFHVAKPDSTIIIIDIDEKSLAAMSSEFGRWPWPRQVFGEFIEKIEQQSPKAIVFDILFSDPDVYNTESDAYFNEVIAQTGTTWFPMVRLPKTADSASDLTINRVPGVRMLSPQGPPATIGIILPYFSAMQESGRLGLTNIVPDIDGVCREYPVYHIEHGYELPSLAYAVTRAEKTRRNVPDRMLLNWRGKPFTYNHISFSDIYADMRIETPARSPREFTGKTIIIGSTAPSLFDIKVTAIDRTFPGVEILATAIDNLHRGDWLRVPDLPYAYFLVMLIILWLTARAFYRKGAGGKLDQFYGLSQIILIGISYTAINLFNVYINLTGPVMFGFAYYSIARYYAFATARALDASVVRVPSDTSGAIGYLIALQFDIPTREEALLAQLASVLKKQCKITPSTEWMTGRQRGFWRLFENTLFLCWKAPRDDHAAISAIRAEADTLCRNLRLVLSEKPMNGSLPYNLLSIRRAEGNIGLSTQGDWRTLMGTTLLNAKVPVS